MLTNSASNVVLAAPDNKQDPAAGLARFLAFIFPRENDQWITALRLGLGLELLIYVMVLRRQWDYFLAGAGAGLLGRQLPEAFLSTETSFVPTIGWLTRMAQKVGLSEQVVIETCWYLLLIASVFLLAGFLCRSSAIVAWLLHLAAAKSGGLLSYGVDNFMTIGLFYLMISPLPDSRALDARLWRFTPSNPQLLGFFRRLLQVHLCIAYFFGGLSKLLGSGWWNGSNIWRALIRPPFNILPGDLLVRWKYFLPALGISIWLLEFSYPALMSLRRTRLLCLVLVCGMHLVIALTMGMYLFGLIMIVLNVAAFAQLPWPREVRALDASPAQSA